MFTEKALSTFDLEGCKKELITFYKYQMSRVQLLPWCDETKQMDDIYVTLKLKDKKKRGKTLLAKNEDLVTLETPEKMPATRILVKGIAGSGKSTLLAKLAYSWAQQNKDSSLSKFQLVFILSLREVLPGSSFIDDIFQQILESNTMVSKEGLKNYIEKHPCEVLLLLDGYDEYSVTDLSSPLGSLQETLAFKMLRQCRTILSTRPHKELNPHQSCYLSVQVLGFSHRNVKLYIKKFFSSNTEMVDGLKARLQESDMLTSLSTIPVMLMLMCLLWEDGQKLPDTQSQLYREFVLYLWRKYCIRKGKQVNFDGKIDEELNEAILGLGSVAFDGICPEGNIKEEKIVFSDTDFKSLLSLGCNTGLLTRERLRSKLNSCSSITFLHKSFQEFCAASYWASLYASAPDQFKGILKRIKTWHLLLSKFELVKFCCGLVEKEGVLLIIQHAIRLYTSYGDHSNQQRRMHHEFLKGEDLKIYVGHNKSDSNRKHVIPILTLLYESTNSLTDCELRDTDTPQQLCSSQSSEKFSNQGEFSLDLSVESHQSTENHALNSLAQSLKSVLPDDKLELDISYNYPVSTSIFHNFVKSELGFLTLSTCTSVKIVNPYTKLEVIVDTLKCLSGTSNIDITFTCKQSDKSEPKKNSLTLLGDALAAMPKLNNIKLGGVSDDRMPDVSILLHHLSTSPNGSNYAHITVKGAMINVSVIVQFLSKVTQLKLLDMENMKITESDKSSGETVQSNTIQHFSLQFTSDDDAMKLQRSDMDPSKNALQNAKLTLIGCDTYILPHHLSTIPCKYSHIRFEKLVINVHFLSIVKHLKQLHMEDIFVTSSDMGSDGTLQSSNNETADLANQKNHIGYLSLLKSDVAIGSKAPNTTLHQNSHREVRMILRDSNAADLILHQMSFSPTHRFGHFTLERVVTSMTSVVHFLSKVEQLKLAANIETVLTRRDVVSGSASPNYHIEHFSLQCADHMQTPGEAKVVFCGCTDDKAIDILLEYLTISKNSNNYVHVTFERVVTDTTTMLKLLKNFKFLKSLELKDIDLTPVDGTVENRMESYAEKIVDHQLQYHTNLTRLVFLKEKNQFEIISELQPTTGAHLQNVNLIYSNLEASLKSLTQMPHFCTKLHTLNVCSASVNKDHIQLLSEFLPQASNLQVLDLSDNTVGMAIQPLTQQLQHCTKLTTLNLCKTNLKEDHIKILSELLPKVSNLQVLDLSGNTVGMAIEPLTHQLQHCTKLTTLNLHNASLKEAHLKILSELLPKVSNLQVLDLSGNTVGMAIEPLTHQLQHCTKLTTLNLHNASLKEDHTEILSDLFPLVSSLHVLNLSQNTVGMAIGLLTQQLLHCTQLTTLNLGKVSLNEDNIKILSELFPKASNLKVLDLSDDTVGMAIGPLTHQLQHCTKLTTLNLRKTNLKEDHIKILSELFPKVFNLQVLDLSDNTVGMAIEPLTQQLQHCTNLTTLNLHNAGLKEDHIQILSELFPRVSNLQVLDLSDNTVGMAIGSLTQQLQHCTQLTTLNLHNASLKEAHLKILSELLPKVSNLQVLDLSRNTVGMAIGSLTQQLQHCTKLTTLNLHNAGLKEDHIQILSELFPKVSNLQVLDLSRNTVGMAIGSLTQQLQHCTKLTTLNLHSASLKEDHIKILSDLFPKVSNLQVLDLSDNTVEMATGTLTHPLQHCTKLTTLNLHNAGLKEDHIKILSELFPKVSNLQVLDLSGNTVGLAIEPLTQQLQHSTHLTTLNLHNAGLKEDHIKILSELFPKVSYLQVLDLSFNTVGMAVVNLAQQVQYCTPLNKLDLHWAHIPDQGIIELAQMFDFLPNLTWLDISDNGDGGGTFGYTGKMVLMLCSKI